MIAEPYQRLTDVDVMSAGFERPDHEQFTANSHNVEFEPLFGDRYHNASPTEACVLALVLDHAKMLGGP